MLRFKVGHSWKREAVGHAGPRDAFILELDGVNLLVGANDEPLLRVVGNLVDAVASLVVEAEPAGQLSLEDVQLEVCFWRRGGFEVETSVISLDQPPQRVRPMVVVELPALVEATLSCARAFLRDSTGTQWRAAHQAEVAGLERRVKELGGSVVAEWSSRAGPNWSASRPTEALGYTLNDSDGRTLTYSRRTRAGLPSLLVEGSVGTDEKKKDGMPFLMLMGLARAATFGPVQFDGQTLSAQVVFSAGLDLCLALRARNPLLATNPWLEALQVRCADGLRALRQPVPDTSTARVSAPRASSPGEPISATGQVRRVKLAPAWQREVALGEEGGRIQLGRTGVLVYSAHAAHAFSSRGAVLFRRLSARGVAATTQHALCATQRHVMAFDGRAESASWFRDHDGSPIGPGLAACGNVWVTTIARRGLAGFDALTGRELWRFDPPRTQHSWATIIGQRVLLATDSGALFGLDPTDGTIRFTIRSSIPCALAPVRWGQRAVAVFNRGEHTAVIVCDVASKGARSGTVRWTRELLLSAPKAPVISGSRVFVAGAHEGRAVIAAISNRGQLLWQKDVPLDARTLSLVATERSVVASDARGACVRVLADGQMSWVVGSHGDELPHAVPLVLARGVLVVPGPMLKLIDPLSGRVLAQVETGPRVIDVAVDRSLTIYALKEPGLLESWRPAAVLALV